METYILKYGVVTILLALITFGEMQVDHGLWLFIYLFYP